MNKNNSKKLDSIKFFLFGVLLVIVTLAIGFTGTLSKIFRKFTKK